MLPYKCLCEGGSPKQSPKGTLSPVFTRYFNSKGDCHAAKEQQRRLATTSIYEMYGREVNRENIENTQRRQI